MEYSHDDPGLLRQPIGYWSWAAYKAVVTRTRGALAEIGTTQPQWWVLARVAHADGGTSRDEVTAVLRGYLDEGEDTVRSEIDRTIALGWITEETGKAEDEDGDEAEEGRLSLTAEGRAFFERAAAVQAELRAERHAGISDEEYLTTLKVLQRFIHNTGGHAWHQ
jgi:DNA-binding MarR family transcriptional regulator